MDLDTLGNLVGISAGLGAMFAFVIMLAVIFGTINWFMPRY